MNKILCSTDIFKEINQNKWKCTGHLSRKHDIQMGSHTNKHTFVTQYTQGDIEEGGWKTSENNMCPSTSKGCSCRPALFFTLVMNMIDSSNNPFNLRLTKGEDGYHLLNSFYPEPLKRSTITQNDF